MRLLTVSLLSGLVLLVSACGPEQARYTVDEYRADNALRHGQVKRCRRDPGTLRKTPDCVNAEAAAALEDRIRLRDAAPIGLGSGKDSPKPTGGQPPGRN